jgi:hypothetical protein
LPNFQTKAGAGGQHELAFLNSDAGVRIVGNQQIPVQVGEIDKRRKVRRSSHFNPQSEIRNPKSDQWMRWTLRRM